MYMKKNILFLFYFLLSKHIIEFFEIFILFHFIIFLVCIKIFFYFQYFYVIQTNLNVLERISLLVIINDPSS